MDNAERGDGTGVFIRSWTIRCFRVLLKANIRSVMPVCLSLCQSIHLSVCMFVSLYVCLSVRLPACKALSSHWTIFIKLDISFFFRNFLPKINFIKSDSSTEYFTQTPIYI